MADVPAPSVVVTPITCIECGGTWEYGWERWRLKVLPDEDGVELVPYCPRCHAREFGDD